MAQEEFEAGGLFLDAFRKLVDFGAEIIVGNERHDSDEQTGRRGDKGLSNPSGDGSGLSQAGFRDNTEGTDHTGNGA